MGSGGDEGERYDGVAEEEWLILWRFFRGVDKFDDLERSTYRGRKRKLDFGLAVWSRFFRFLFPRSLTCGLNREDREILRANKLN